MHPAIGSTGKDRITGFTGLVMARCEYITGCHQLLLTPTELDKDGKRREGEWFDEVRVELGPNPKLVLDGTAVRDNPGADEPAAPRI